MTDARIPGSDRPDHDREPDETTPREPAVAPEDRDERGEGLDTTGSEAPAVDFGTPREPAGDVGSPREPAVDFGAPAAVPVRESTDGETEVIEPQASHEAPVSADDRAAGDRAVDGATSDEPVTAETSADERDDAPTPVESERVEGASDRDQPTAVVPPVVAPTPPPARAWSATSGDDSARRTLHDDDALRAAEASRSEPRDGGSRGGQDAPTVAAPIASDSTRASSADDATDRSRDDAPTVAAPSAAATTAYPTQPGTGAYPLVADGGVNHVALRRDLLTQQKDEFGGIRFGAGLLGWFAATGFGVVIMSIYGGVVAAWVAASGTPTSNMLGFQQFVSDNGRLLSAVTAIVVLVVIFAGYLIGGFTASRVARFSGFKQGVATWLWGLVVSVILAVVGFVALGVSPFSSSSDAGSTPMESPTSIESIVFVGLVVVLSFVGAVLGGLLGQRWHRKVDRFIPSDQV